MLRLSVVFAVLYLAYAKNDKGSEFYQRFMTKRAGAPAPAAGKQNFVFQSPGGLMNGNGFGGYGPYGHGYGNLARIHPVPVTGVKALSVAYDAVSGVPYVCDPNKKADDAKPAAPGAPSPTTGKRSEVEKVDVEKDEEKKEEVQAEQIQNEEPKTEKTPKDEAQKDDEQKENIQKDEQANEESQKDEQPKEESQKDEETKVEEQKDEETKAEEQKDESEENDEEQSDKADKDEKKDEIKVKIPDYPPCPDPKKSFPWSCILGGSKSAKRAECAKAKKAVEDAKKRYWPALGGFYPPFIRYGGYGGYGGYGLPFSYGAPVGLPLNYGAYLG